MVTLKPNIKTFIVRAYIFENDIDHYFFFQFQDMWKFLINFPALDVLTF